MRQAHFSLYYSGIRFLEVNRINRSIDLWVITSGILLVEAMVVVPIFPLAIAWQQVWKPCPRKVSGAQAKIDFTPQGYCVHHSKPNALGIYGRADIFVPHHEARGDGLNCQ